MQGMLLRTFCMLYVYGVDKKLFINLNLKVQIFVVCRKSYIVWKTGAKLRQRHLLDWN